MFHENDRFYEVKMATVGFGIIRKIDEHRDYSVLNSYRAAMREFGCVSVVDEFAGRCLEDLSHLPVSYGMLRRRGAGLDLYGVNIISYKDVPEVLNVVKKMRSSADFDKRGCVLNGEGEFFDYFEDLIELLEEVIRAKAYLIIFGI